MKRTPTLIVAMGASLKKHSIAYGRENVLHGAAAYTCMALECYSYGMTRARVSTTVDGQLLNEARSRRKGVNDATLFDEALAALLHRYRGAEIDAAYAAYEATPIDELDDWGSLGEFRNAAGAS